MSSISFLTLGVDWMEGGLDVVRRRVGSRGLVLSMLGRQGKGFTV